MRCPKCDTTLPDDAGFCLRCGASITGAPSAPVPVDPIRAALERALSVQYEIGRLLGRGGMGAVYWGREKALERDVAIKVLPPGATEMSPDSRERFRREARTAAQLTHSNIVPLYTFGETDGLAFFVMGFVRGESLASRMKREGRLPFTDVIRILGQLADALDYAHRKGIVHRDVKPDNVMLDDESGRPMLTDFGIAKGEAGGEALTRTGMIVGTPAYMSPEQASGERHIDGRSDLYALGVLGYEMLAGRAPFEGGSVQELLMQHIAQVPVPLKAVVRDAPEGVAAAVMRCLEKDPARRFPDGSALRFALETQSDSVDLLPEDLRGMRGFAPLMLVISYVGVVAIFGALGATGPSSEVTRLVMQWAALVPTLMLLGGAAIAPWLRWHGKHPWSEIRRIMLLAPRWWPFPWPRQWSFPSVADRLPPIIRRWRWTFALAATVMLGVFLPASGAAIFAQEPLANTLMNIAIGALLVGQLPYAAASLHADRWGKKRGLESRESLRLLQMPLTTEFWRRPRIAALLLPETRTARTPEEPQSPTDLLRAIGDLVQHLGTSYREVTETATSAARDAVIEIDGLDRVIASLSAEAEPAEVMRLERRLADLAMDSPVRPLLSRQFDLLRSLVERIGGLAERRARVGDMLRTLWLQLANLHALQAADAPAAREITGRIRALCASVAHEISAEQEAVRILEKGSR